MKHQLLFALILATLAPAATVQAQAQPAPNRFAATIVPAERFDIGAVQVEKHGKRGRALILIPGLASGAWVWQETVRQFAGEHVLYVVTLPGFDGRAAVPGPAMAAAQQALAQLVETRKLEQPVLVGHSLGGTLSFALAAQLGQRIGGVVSIDGLPVFPGSEELTPMQRSELVRSFASRVALADPVAFAAQQQQYMRGIGVTDMARADELAKLSAKSDPRAVLQYMGETFALDLRVKLPAISAPVLVLAPYFNDDDTQNQLSQADKVSYYKSLLAGAPKAEVVGIAPARHFAMFDQPQQVHDALRKFILSL